MPARLAFQKSRLDGRQVVAGLRLGAMRLPVRLLGALPARPSAAGGIANPRILQRRIRESIRRANLALNDNLLAKMWASDGLMNKTALVRNALIA